MSAWTQFFSVLCAKSKIFELVQWVHRLSHILAHFCVTFSLWWLQFDSVFSTINLWSGQLREIFLWDITSNFYPKASKCFLLCDTKNKNFEKKIFRKWKENLATVSCHPNLRNTVDAINCCFVLHLHDPVWSVIMVFCLAQTNNLWWAQRDWLIYEFIGGLQTFCQRDVNQFDWSIMRKFTAANVWQLFFILSRHSSSDSEIFLALIGVTRVVHDFEYTHDFGSHDVPRVKRNSSHAVSHYDKQQWHFPFRFAFCSQTQFITEMKALNDKRNNKRWIRLSFVSHAERKWREKFEMCVRMLLCGHWTNMMKRFDSLSIHRNSHRYGNCCHLQLLLPPTVCVCSKSFRCWSTWSARLRMQHNFICWNTQWKLLFFWKKRVRTQRSNWWNTKFNYHIDQCKNLPLDRWLYSKVL